MDPMDFSTIRFTIGKKRDPIVRSAAILGGIRLTAFGPDPNDPSLLSFEAFGENQPINNFQNFLEVLRAN
jgi:hypothetical protein